MHFLFNRKYYFLFISESISVAVMLLFCDYVNKKGAILYLNVKTPACHAGVYLLKIGKSLRTETIDILFERLYNHT